LYAAEKVAMTRSTALQIFGLDETASNAAVWAAYSALRAHLESRLRAADEMERTGVSAFYREQLRELDAALTLLTEPDSTSSTSSVATRAAGTHGAEAPASKLNLRRGLAGLIVVLAGFIVIFWGLSWISTDEGGSENSEDVALSQGLAAEDTSPEAPSEPDARLALSGNLEGAVASIIDSSTGETLWQGPADGRSHELPQGDYTLVVEHPKCPDSWTQEVHLEAGQQADRLARNCLQHGLLTLGANVEKARVSIDGRDAQALDDTETALPAGPHRIRVEGEGREPWETSVDLAAASRVTLQANLAPRAEAPAQAPPAPVVTSAAPAPEIQQSTPESDASRRTHEWQETARQYLLSRYDRDQSGSLDSLAEIDSIPCGDWRGLEQSFDGGGLALSMTRFYGFDGSKWIDNAFGVTDEMRGSAYLRLKECGLR
jgi:hypothetical protein